MKLIHLEEEGIEGTWKADWTHICPSTNPYDILETYHPVLEISETTLREITYKDLAKAIDPNFLRQGMRATALRGVRFTGFNDDTMTFMVTASLEHRPYGETVYKQRVPEYTCLVKFMSWDDIGGDPDLTPREKALMLLWSSDIQIWCNDPSQLYWGYQYILTQLNASIYPENRPPDINNPQHRGVCCKHLNRVLKALPFYNADLAKEITNQFGGQLTKKELDAIRKRNDMWRNENGVQPENTITG